MNSDLVALGFALVLGVVVVILGLRRNLSETTRNGLPQLGADPEGAAIANPDLFEGEERRRRPLSPRQRRMLIPLYLLIAITQAAFAVEKPQDRLIHAALAAVTVVWIVVFLLRESPDPSDEMLPDPRS